MKTFSSCRCFYRYENVFIPPSRENAYIPSIMKTLTLRGKLWKRFHTAALFKLMKALTFPAAASFKNENVFIFRSALTSTNFYIKKVLCIYINTYWTYFFTLQEAFKMIKNPLKAVKIKEKRWKSAKKCKNLMKKAWKKLLLPAAAPFLGG